MAGKARFISGVFRAFAMARENRAERLAIFFYLQAWAYSIRIRSVRLAASSDRIM